MLNTGVKEDEYRLCLILLNRWKVRYGYIRLTENNGGQGILDKRQILSEHTDAVGERIK
jgi:hypothetical protein